LAITLPAVTAAGVALFRSRCTRPASTALPRRRGYRANFHNDQQFLVSAAPFQGDVKPVGNLRLEIGVGHDRPLTSWWRFLNPLFASVSVSSMPLFAGGRRHSLQEPSPLRLAWDDLAIDGPRVDMSSRSSAARPRRRPSRLSVRRVPCLRRRAWSRDCRGWPAVARRPGRGALRLWRGLLALGLRRPVTCWYSAPPPLFEYATIRSSVTGRLLWQKG
jgi:hypothetical protein